MPDEHAIAGEDNLIQAYFAPLAAGFPGAFGLQDDCAALTPEPGHDLVLNTDAIAEGVHFLPGDAPADIAWKVLAVNVSDIAAKGAKPVAYLLSLSFRQMPERAWMDGFAAGLRDAQESFGIALAGGDTDRRPNAPVSVTVMAIGSVPAGRMLRRGGGRAGDILYVSGTLGDSALGLRLRSGVIGEKTAAQIGAADRSALEQRYLRPQPRVQLRSALLDHAHASMDISDGLVKDLRRMCQASGVGAEVRADRVPLSSAARSVLGVVPELAHLPLSGGDDYEILASVPPEKAAAFESAALAAGVAVTAIGALREETGVDVRDANGQPVDVTNPGYDHF
jgi:thiamine-monophosphate kinase